MTATAAVFAAAPDERAPRRPAAARPSPSWPPRAAGTEAFAVGSSFVGFFVFVTFIALVATEFSGGTFRALLLRDPHRLRLITGKLAGALVVAAGAIALTELVSFGLSAALAPSKDIDAGAWLSVDGLGHALADYATVLAGVTGWAVFGTTLAVIFRSVPLALGVGFAWAGPLENIVVDSWTTGYRVFPGQVLAAVIQGGTPEISLSRAAADGPGLRRDRGRRHRHPPHPKGRHLMITTLATCADRHQPGARRSGGLDRWHRAGAGWIPVLPVVPLFVIGLWVLLFTLVIRRRWRMAPGQSAESVLAERFARGEIDEAEYRKRRTVLRRRKD